MLFIWFLGLLHIAVSAYAAPPPDASGQFSDWFRSLTVPGIPGAPCCTMANCRMVEARWNDWTRHYEAQVTRERFSTTAWKQILSQGTGEAYQAARSAWMRQWLSRYGANADVWIEVPEAKVSAVQNPTGHAVLCWSIFNTESNGVFCFIPYQGV
jgi:hypothetical protein